MLDRTTKVYLLQKLLHNSEKMDGLLILLLLLHCTAVTVSQNCTQEGAVEIIGTVTPTLIAGRLEICVDGLWRAVYDPGWGITAARTVCEQKGFPSENAIACTGSCFGKSPLTTDGYYFLCKREGNSLMECPKNEIRRCCCYSFKYCSSNYDTIHQCCPPEFATGCSKYCFKDAGVVCTRPSEAALNCSSPLDDSDKIMEANETEEAGSATPPEPLQNICDDEMLTACIVELSQVTTTSTTSSPGGTITSPGGVVSNPKGMVKSSSDIQSTSTTIEDSCRTTEAVLGGILVIALFALVGVVTAWVWSCQKTKLTTKQRSLNADRLDAMENPQYTPIHSFVQYSTLSPGNRPIIGHTSLPQPEVEYHEVRTGPQTASSDDSSLSYESTPATTYSRLQHNFT